MSRDSHTAAVTQETADAEMREAFSEALQLTEEAMTERSDAPSSLYYRRKLAESDMPIELAKEIGNLLDRALQSETVAMTEDDFGAPLADTIASAHRNSGMPNPEFRDWKLDTLRERIWELSYEINRLRGATPAAPVSPTPLDSDKEQR